MAHRVSLWHDFKAHICITMKFSSCILRLMFQSSFSKAAGPPPYGNISSGTLSSRKHAYQLTIFCKNNGKERSCGFGLLLKCSQTGDRAIPEPVRLLWTIPCVLPGSLVSCAEWSINGLDLLPSPLIRYMPSAVRRHRRWKGVGDKTLPMLSGTLRP